MSIDLLSMQRQFLQQMISPQPTVDPSPGMQAYRDAYLLRFDEALRTDFAAIHQILGDDEMLALTTDYIEQHPSDNPSIRWIGRHLAAFISASPKWSSVPLLHEMARFEWAKSCLFDAKDGTVSTLAELQSIAPEHWGNLRFELVPALTIEHLPGNVPPIFQQLSRQENVASPEVEAEVPWLIWRKELLVHWRSLDNAEHHALRLAQSGATFAEICQQLIDYVDEEEIPNLAMQLLLQWCNDQIIHKFQP